MTNEEILQLLVSAGGSTGLNNVENIFGGAGNIFSQFGMGVIAPEAVERWVLGNAYDPYTANVDPMQAQMEVNDVLKRLAASLNIVDQDLDGLVSLVSNNGFSAEQAITITLPGLLEGRSGLGLDDSNKALLEALQLNLEAHAEFADMEDRYVFDDRTGMAYLKKDPVEAQKIMEDAGFVGLFSSPELWVEQQNPERLRAAEEAAQQADFERQELRVLEGFLRGFDKSRRVPVVGGSAPYDDPTVTQGLLEFFNDKQGFDPGIYQRMRDEGLEVGSGTSFIDLAGAAGGEDATLTQPLTDRSSPALNASSTLANQQDQAIKAAQRYATFAAADQAQKKGQGGSQDVRRKIQDLTAAVPLPMGGVQTRQDSLDAVAESNRIRAQEEAFYPGQVATDAFIEAMADKVPSTKSVRPARVRLSSDQISRTVDGILAPTRRRV